MIAMSLLLATSLASAAPEPLGTNTHYLPTLSTCSLDKNDYIINGDRYAIAPFITSGANKIKMLLAPDNTTAFFVKLSGFQAESLIASALDRALSAPGQEHFPRLSTCQVDQNLVLLSQTMKDFKTIRNISESFDHNKSNSFNFKDEFHINPSMYDSLASLYTLLYLVGGGDPHPSNIVFNPYTLRFGDVDIDVVFKLHISFYNQEKFTITKSKTHNDLALKSFDCNNPCANFLTMTDSKIQSKSEMSNIRYDIYLKEPFCDGVLSPLSLINAMQRLTKHPWSTLQETIQSTHKQLEEFRSQHRRLQLNGLHSLEHYLNFVQDRYDFMSAMAWHYEEKHQDYSNLYFFHTPKTIMEDLSCWCSMYKTDRV